VKAIEANRSRAQKGTTPQAHAAAVKVIPTFVVCDRATVRGNVSGYGGQFSGTRSVRGTP